VLFFVATVCSISPIDYAAAQHMNVKGVPCNKPSSNAEETQCFYVACRVADKDLNQFYGQAMKALDPEDQQRLRDAQRLWVQYRDATCTAEKALYGSGTGGPTTYNACMEAFTR